MLAQNTGLSTVDSYRLILWANAAIAVTLVMLCARLSKAVEANPTGSKPRWGDMHRSGGTIARFALLTGLNTLGAWFVVQSFVAYWFVAQIGADAATLGVIFFLTNLVGALSYL